MPRRGGGWAEGNIKEGVERRRLDGGRGWGVGGLSSSNSEIQSNNYSAHALHCEAKSCAAGFNSSSTGAIVSITGDAGGGQLKRETVEERDT